MKVVKPYIEVVDRIDGDAILKKIEYAGRVCYKSEDKIGEETAKKFCKMALDKGHHSVIEHCHITFKFICDRGVTHEIVRHRLANYSQESTIYCNYSQDKFGNEITYIEPFFFYQQNARHHEGIRQVWESAMRAAEQYYFNLLSDGANPAEARSVLPNSLKTEIVMTANIREWRWFIKQRTSPNDHPQIKQFAFTLQEYLAKKVPVLFDDLYFVPTVPLVEVREKK